MSEHPKIREKNPNAVYALFTLAIAMGLWSVQYGSGAKQHRTGRDYNPKEQTLNSALAIQVDEASGVELSANKAEQKLKNILIKFILESIAHILEHHDNPFDAIDTFLSFLKKEEEEEGNDKHHSHNHSHSHTTHYIQPYQELELYTIIKERTSEELLRFLNVLGIYPIDINRLQEILSSEGYVWIGGVLCYVPQDLPRPTHPIDRYN